MSKKIFASESANVFKVEPLFVSIRIGRERSYTVIVVEQQAARVGFYDSRTGAKFGSVAVGFKPHEIELSKDGETASVSNFGIGRSRFSNRHAGRERFVDRRSPDAREIPIPDRKSADEKTKRLFRAKRRTASNCVRPALIRERNGG